MTPELFDKVSNSDTLKSLIKVVEAQGKNSEFTAKCMYILSDASVGSDYVGDISDLPKLSDIGEEDKGK